MFATLFAVQALVAATTWAYPDRNGNGIAAVATRETYQNSYASSVVARSGMSRGRSPSGDIPYVPAPRPPGTPVSSFPPVEGLPDVPSAPAGTPRGFDPFGRSKFDDAVEARIIDVVRRDELAIAEIDHQILWPVPFDFTYTVTMGRLRDRISEDERMIKAEIIKAGDFDQGDDGHWGLLVLAAKIRVINEQVRRGFPPDDPDRFIRQFNALYAEFLWLHNSALENEDKLHFKPFCYSLLSGQGRKRLRETSPEADHPPVQDLELDWDKIRWRKKRRGIRPS